MRVPCLQKPNRLFFLRELSCVRSIFPPASTIWSFPKRLEITNAHATGITRVVLTKDKSRIPPRCSLACGFLLCFDTLQTLLLQLHFLLHCFHRFFLFLLSLLNGNNSPWPSVNACPHTMQMRTELSAAKKKPLFLPRSPPVFSTTKRSLPAEMHTTPSRRRTLGLTLPATRPRRW